MGFLNIRLEGKVSNIEVFLDSIDELLNKLDVDYEIIGNYEFEEGEKK